MTMITTRWLDMLRRFARRRFPSLFVRVTRRDVRRAQEQLNSLTEEEIEEGREAARRAIAAARERDRDTP